MKMHSFFIGVAALFFFLSGCETKLEDEEIVYTITYKQITMTDATVLDFVVVYPDDLDLTKDHPVLIAFPPGDQSKSMVEWGLNTYWIDWTKKRN